MKNKNPKRWTEEHARKLVELYPVTPVEELAIMFDRSVANIYVVANELGAKKNKTKGRCAWSKAKLKKFARLYPKKSITELLEIFGTTRSSIATRASKMGLRKKSVHHWTDAEKEMLAELYPDTSNIELAKIFKVNDQKIQNLANRIGLKKSEAFMANPANRSCFPPGHVPLNKGKKQVEYMSKEMIARTTATRFKKGQLPKNTLQDGIITTRHSHKKRGARPYKWIRIGLAKWRMYHVYLWEQANGAVPEGHLIIFKDKDTMNCTLENLMMITRAEHARRNYNPEKAQQWARELNDTFVASRLSLGNKRLRKKLINEPELLETARANMLLKRQIKKAKKS